MSIRLNLSQVNLGTKDLTRYNFFSRLFHRTVNISVVNDIPLKKSKFSFLITIFQKLFGNPNYKKLYFDRNKSISWLRDHGQAIDLNAKSSEIALALCKIIKMEQKHTTPILKTGGFANEGNTCFIASVMQLLKSSPPCMKMIKEKQTSLARRTNESDAKFDLRKTIVKELYRLLNEANNGRTISSKEMRNFHQLLAQENPNLHPDKGGDAQAICENLLFITDVFNETSIGGIGFEDRDFNSEIHDFQALVEGFTTPPIVMPISLIRSGIIIDLPSKIELKFDEDGVKRIYRLIGAVQHTGIDLDKGFENAGHSIAYVKDQENWVIFDDGRKSVISEGISEAVNKQINLLLYERVD